VEPPFVTLVEWLSAHDRLDPADHENPMEELH
jgi:hypothetical protein